MFLVAIGPEILLQAVLVVFDGRPKHHGHTVGEKANRRWSLWIGLNGVRGPGRMSGQYLEVLVAAADVTRGLAE